MRARSGAALRIAVGVTIVLAAIAATAPRASAAPGRGSTLVFTGTTATTTTTASTPQTRLTSAAATGIFLRNHKVASWLHRYPSKVGTSATFANGSWTVNVFSGKAGEIATGKVDDASGSVTQAYTGPQVAWGMARGGTGFGGPTINSYSTWLAFCAVFLLVLVDWRRPFSVRTLDLLALLSLSASLWFFNRGNIFAAMPLVYPVFAWLIARCLWIAGRDRPHRGSVVWPTWVIVAATLVLIVVRVDITANHSYVIDVGLSGVIGADRIAHFQSPYGTFPTEQGRPACGPADSNGDIRNHIQTNGRCEAADAQGDTYGPVAYWAYLPAYLFFGWSGVWDSLPTAHATTILWDLIAIAGMWMVGLRFGGPRLGATLAFAWAAWPFTQYSASSNTNDLIGPALLVWGFYFLTSPFKRGAFSALSAWTKFSSLVVLPLWSAYPDAHPIRPRLRYVWGCVVATVVAFSVLLLDPSLGHAVRVFYDHTFGYQFSRSSPFSIWDWRQYHAKGLPDLRWVQRVLYGLLVAGTIVLAFRPRRRSPLRMAAYTGALLVGFESVLTHWSWLYLPWFFPFVAFALLSSRTAEPVPVLADPWRAQVRLMRESWTPAQLRLIGLGGAIALFLGCWSLLSDWFYAHPRIFDTPIFESYGLQIARGLVPYRDFAVEWPPGALPSFYLPTLWGSSYFDSFSGFMAACGIGCLVFAWLTRPPWTRLLFIAVSPLLLGSLGTGHFDLWAAMFVTGALAAFVRERYRLGWAALAAAVAVKLFALVLLPLAVIWTLRRRGRRELGWDAVVFAAVTAAAFVPFLVLAPHGLWRSLWGQLSRPVQIETIPGAFLRMVGNPAILQTHGSVNLAGAGAYEAGLTVALVVALVALWIAFARGPAEAGRLLRYSAACICAFLVFGKVLSPQFLVWLVPVVPLVRGRRGLVATLLLGVALVATMIWFPNRYYAYVITGHLAWMVFARDLVLVAILVVLALPGRRTRGPVLAPAREAVPRREIPVATLD
jgi:hypothetical protein